MRSEAGLAQRREYARLRNERRRHDLDYKRRQAAATAHYKARMRPAKVPAIITPQIVYERLLASDSEFAEMERQRRQIHEDLGNVAPVLWEELGRVGD